MKCFIISFLNTFSYILRTISGYNSVTAVKLVEEIPRDGT